MVKKRSGDINIPLDLMVEILKRLPAKSLARFLCVSYEWQSIINNFIMIDSIVTRCLTQPPRDPHFIFHKRSQRFCTFSYAQLHRQITNEKQLYHQEIFVKSKGHYTLKIVQYVRGLIGFLCSQYFHSIRFTIHNPTTKQSLSLPSTRPRNHYMFGFDPFKNQYKVLCLARPYGRDQPCKVFILGDPLGKWRDIECNIRTHNLFGEAVCINGTIYYKACTYIPAGSHLVSFDVRFEKFTLIQAPEDFPVDHEDSTLVNNQGKLGCICRNSLNENDVDLWVMENAEKQEWSKITYLSMLQGLPNSIKFAGVTHPGGEIIIVDCSSKLALDVHYYDPKQNNRRTVKIQTRNVVQTWAVTDNVENVMRL